MHIDYYGPCDERNEFYRRRDKLTQFQRSKKFLELFHDYDREQARLHHARCDFYVSPFCSSCL